MRFLQTPAQPVAGLACCRLIKQRGATHWDMVAVEQSLSSTALAPALLENAIQPIQTEGDFSIYRQLRRIFQNEAFFRAHYEISLCPRPEALAASWTGSTGSLISVVSITDCSPGPVEMTHTWFDAHPAVLIAGSLDVKLVGPTGTD
jgi:hypothetical protein